MSIIRVIVELLVLYFFYKLIFDFVIPVYKTSKQVKQKVDEMQSQMKEHIKQQQNKFTPSQEPITKPRKEDYIEYEDVK